MQNLQGISKMNPLNDLKSIINDLEPIEVFDYYDGPKFYSCRDKAGQIFIVYWIEENAIGNKWIYIKTSTERLNAIKSGQISIAAAFSNPEDEKALIIQSGPNDFDIDVIEKSKINPQWLPSEDLFLNLKTSTLPEKGVEPIVMAEASYRHVLDIALDRINKTIEVPAAALGSILQTIQSVIDALGCGPESISKRVPEAIKQRNQLNVTGLFASSFGVRLQSNDVSIAGNEFLEKDLENFVTLIENLNEPSSIGDKLLEINLTARGRFKHLLKLMKDSQFSFKASWGGPTGNGRQVTASFQAISQSLAAIEIASDIETNTITKSGTLVGIDVEGDFFALKIDNNNLLKGKISNEMAQHKFSVPSEVNATIEVSAKNDSISESTKLSYKLINII
ncbi:DUF6575 domain-containing protein [Comamonas jiangduensis]|uniref:DUF6575 domain-containing protein n=1 Tax=Comamonas jiangduensis TaxID=1194168 RepID=UPI003BF87157